MGYKHKDACPLVIYKDNQGAVALSKNVQFYERTHYIEKRYYFVREHVYKGDTKIKHINTNNNIINGLLKPLNANRHKAFLKQLGMQ